MSEPTAQPTMNSPHEAADRTRRAFVLLAAVIALLGALTPAAALLRGGGLRGSLNDTALMLAFWGLSPFVLLPVAARVAKRPLTRRLVILLGALACGFGMLGHFAGLVPRVPNANDSLAFIFIPVWQWPMVLLATVLALFVPGPAGPPASAENDRTWAKPVPPA